MQAAGSFVGPGLINFDVAAYKDFRFSERWQAQLRGEFFNVLNHTNFNPPNSAQRRREGWAVPMSRIGTAHPS